jgi:hypothetical protein
MNHEITLFTNPKKADLYFLANQEIHRILEPKFDNGVTRSQ